MVLCQGCIRPEFKVFVIFEKTRFRYNFINIGTSNGTYGAQNSLDSTMYVFYRSFQYSRSLSGNQLTENRKMLNPITGYASFILPVGEKNLKVSFEKSSEIGSYDQYLNMLFTFDSVVYNTNQSLPFSTNAPGSWSYTCNGRQATVV